MKHLALTFLFLLGSSLPVSALEVGDSIPAEAAKTPMKNVTGDMVTIDGVKGAKGTLVVFTCNHCPWAKAWEERTAETGNALLGKGIGVIAVNSNDPTDYPDDKIEVMAERAKARGMKFPYAVDGTSNVARAFGATKTPEFYLFDPAGKLVYTGALDDNAKEPSAVKEKYLAKAADELAEGRPISEPKTKSIGCSIKFRK